MSNLFLKGLRWLDDNLERYIILVAYSVCAGIIAFEVGRRFLLGQQASWSTTIPAYMFVWLAWPGAAYGVKVRAHLAFSDFRQRLPRHVQYILMQLDYVLFIIFACVAVYYSINLLTIQVANGSVVPGTLTVPSWWFYLATPVGWALLAIRVVQNAFQDFIALRSGAPLDLGGGIAALK